MSEFAAGQIVIADWRDSLPKEPNKLRPAIVVEDTELFGPSYPNLILVPLTEDRRLAMPDLSLVIDPSPENGCTKRCYAIAHSVITTSKRRVTATGSRISAEQLRVIRQQIAFAIGLEVSASISE